MRLVAGVYCTDLHMLNEKIRQAILGAESKALGTSGPAGLNVVPVSVVEVEGDEILLYNFFMGKTAENLSATASGGGEVSLSCWSGYRGVQVRARVQYVTTGERFKAATTALAERFPERVLKALIVLTPTAVYDTSVGTGTAGTQIAPV